MLQTTENLNSANMPADLSKLTQGQLELLLSQAEYAAAEREALKGKNQEQMIEFYLDYRQSKNPELNANYPNNPKGKTIKDCYEYIVDAVQKQSHGQQGAMVHHDEVFAMAEKYFIDDSIEKFERKVAPTPIYHPSTAKMSKAEREKKAQEWETQHQEKIQNWVKDNEKKAEKWQKEHDKKVLDWQCDMFADHSVTPDFVNEPNPYTLEQCAYLKEENPYKTEDKATTAAEPTSEPAAETPNNEQPESEEEDLDEDDIEEEENV